MQESEKIEALEKRIKALEGLSAPSPIDYEALLNKFVRWTVIESGEQIGFWWNLPPQCSDGVQWYGKWTDAEIEKIKEIEEHWAKLRRKLMDGQAA